MARMVRKQVYLRRRQTAMLKRQAKETGSTESELIRQAIDRQVIGSGRLLSPDPRAWERAHDLMLELNSQGPLVGRRRQWTRDELYEERMNRYGSRSG